MTGDVVPAEDERKRAVRDAPPLWVPLRDACDLEISLVGGKARSLARLIAAGLPVPEGIVVTTRAYRDFLVADGLAARVALAVDRKQADDTRWEELWDASERVRTAMHATPMPPELRDELLAAVARFDREAVVVRSSSPHEDAAERSFAGLHDSVVGVTGAEDVLRATLQVWASLWSDRAMLYRAETGQTSDAAMAVVVQHLASSDRAGVAFTRGPVDPARGVIEAVWGLGEGLVSGTVEPDHWEVDRGSGRLLAHIPAADRTSTVRRGAEGVVLETLPRDLRARAPLSEQEVGAVWELATAAEGAFGEAQDTEWAFDEGAPVLTQSRPITTGLPDDDRRWYLTLTPSAERLAESRARIEREILPGMRATSDALSSADLAELSDLELADFAEVVAGAVGEARRVYHDELIPFAHGARVFGAFYNAKFAPEDPFEFTGLLVRDSAGQRAHGELLAQLGIEWQPPPDADDALSGRVAAYLAGFDEAERDAATSMLELGRASWALRDDDNLYLDLVERHAGRVLGEVVSRRSAGGSQELLEHARVQLEGLAEGSLDSNRAGQAPQSWRSGAGPRQLVGQPAGPGIAEGPARIVRLREDLASIEPGDIIVVDALEPDTAAFASRAAGIVERRGGMLVHGAIVAREWGLACVTGVPGATTVIAEGEPLVVDGYLGIVTRTRV